MAEKNATKYMFIYIYIFVYFCPWSGPNEVNYRCEGTLRLSPRPVQRFQYDYNIHASKTVFRIIDHVTAR